MIKSYLELTVLTHEKLSITKVTMINGPQKSLNMLLMKSNREKLETKLKTTRTIMIS
jgi:hypothetical protein